MLTYDIDVKLVSVVMYPRTQSILGDTSPAQSFWLPFALTNAALFNALLFCTDACCAGWRGQWEWPNGVKHMHEAVRLINESLENATAKLDDATVAGVMMVDLGEVCMVP
jgi:hypothetical protein